MSVQKYQVEDKAVRLICLLPELSEDNKKSKNIGKVRITSTKAID